MTPGPWRLDGQTIYTRTANPLFQIRPQSAEGSSDLSGNMKAIERLPDLVTALKTIANAEMGDPSVYAREYARQVKDIALAALAGLSR
jgi:hypothetical protein